MICVIPIPSATWPYFKYHIYLIIFGATRITQIICSAISFLVWERDVELRIELSQHLLRMPPVKKYETYAMRIEKVIKILQYNFVPDEGHGVFSFLLFTICFAVFRIYISLELRTPFDRCTHPLIQSSQEWVKAWIYGLRVGKWEGGAFHPLFLLSH